ncbi:MULTISPECIES: SRPBCC family protein [unclassified Methylomonas]|uniref:SRPBCC family protein n=1 Tax=unclassified Methylomonas TaxID=2608980 RepID=UPI0008DB2E1F|nr:MULTISPECIES: SRPBCC family protein [unclassified Methylomonas]MDT4331871.1 SRPBCC family protein [Methylomonas sp. MV1]OHX35760.1 polyketide cyclase [Methylomonas sp. LWB]WGS85969.1 SRPBCC family protein [Methylomonas sp. UP202]
MTDLDPRLDLTFERITDLPKDKIWQAWTVPAHVLPWFCPLPWKTVACEIDLKPGGAFRTTMRSPEGEEFPHLGTYLDIVENRRLVWTNALLPGFRPKRFSAGDEPAACGDFAMTGIIELSDHPQGTLYKATVLHADVAGRDQHAAMGFEDGWGKAFEQLVAYMKSC